MGGGDQELKVAKSKVPAKSMEKRAKDQAAKEAAEAEEAIATAKATSFHGSQKAGCITRARRCSKRTC